MNIFRINILIIIKCLYLSNGFNIIELNHDVGPHTPFYPVQVNTTFKSTVQEAGYSRGFWLAYSEITVQDHLSTYLSAPSSQYEFGRRVDEIPFRDLFASAAVFDVREKVARNNSYEVSVEDVKNWVKKYGIFPKHCIVLFNFGWDEGRFPDQLAYFGTVKSLSEMKFPLVTLEALITILAYEKSHGIHFVGFGSDTPSLNPNFFITDRMVLEMNKYIIKSLRDLKRLPPIGARIMAMPMKIKRGFASPVRVAAQLPYY